MQDRKFICPCERHERDIAETGHCLCALFVDDSYEPPRLAISTMLNDGSWPEIVVYGARWCGDTIRAVSWLNRHGVPYRWVDVEEDKAAAQQVMAWNRGYRSTPTLDIGGRIVVEPSDSELATILETDD